MLLRFKTDSDMPRKITPRTWYFQNFIGSSYNQVANVPAVFTTGLFTFSFEEEAKRTGLLKNKSSESIRRILAVIAQIDEAINDTDLRRLLIDSNLNLALPREDNTGNLKDVKLTEKDLAKKDLEDIRLLRQQMVTKFAMSGMSNAILTDVLTTSTTQMAWDDFKKITLEEIGSSINVIQRYYAKYAESMSVEDLVSYAKTEIFNSRVCKFVDFLVRTMTAPEGTSMQARLSYVHNEIFSQIYGEPYVGIEPVIDALEYKVKDISQLEDLGYVEAFAGYVTGMRMIMGGSVSGSMKNDVSLRDIIDSQILHTQDFLPFIPSDLGSVDEEKLSKNFSKRWVYHVIRRVASADYGQLINRINTITDIRKYRRNDSLDNALQRANIVSSIVFDSFLDVTSEFKDIIEDQNVYFVDLHPLRREKFSEFFFKFLGSFNSFRASTDHPRFLYEPANLVNHNSGVIMTPVEVDFAVPEEAAKSVTTQIFNQETMDGVQYLRTTILKGSVLDTTVKLNPNLVATAGTFTPKYLTKLKKSAVLDTDLFATVGRIVPQSALFRKSGIPSYLLQEGNIYLFFSAEQMASELRIPLPIAKHLYSPSESGYIVFPRFGDVILTWEFELAPIYEVHMEEKVTYIPPFVAPWPFLVSRTIHQGIKFTKEPLKIGKPPIAVPNKDTEAPPTPPEFDPNAPVV